VNEGTSFFEGYCEGGSAVWTKYLRDNNQLSNLWSRNTPDEYWGCPVNIARGDWEASVAKSIPLLGIPGRIEGMDELLALTLGEGRFGPDHWNLSRLKRLYYLLKPILPRSLTRILRRYYGGPIDDKVGDIWPIDPRYVLFQQEVLRKVLMATGKEMISYKRLWPADHDFALVLTHDIETAKGQSFVWKLADLEESLGFRSSFNFVLERYPLDMKLIQELRDRGFEIGCHGLKHDGKLFNTRNGFMKKAEKINALMKDYKMVGFRSPLTHRNPEWMQILDIEYDSSFFDTDPFEPIPGGVMSIWPFFLGHFVELPYTLVQDYTLTAVLGEKTPRIWLDKLKFIKDYHGMALLNTHPDYLVDVNNLRIYTEFLQTVQNEKSYWHALARDVAAWWKTRAEKSTEVNQRDHQFGEIVLKGEKISVNS
jgi:peptidoglycan/xylan/chitin deacetylase (PgdA/CDA1 family)